MYPLLSRVCRVYSSPCKCSSWFLRFSPHFLGLPSPTGKQHRNYHQKESLIVSHIEEKSLFIRRVISKARNGTVEDIITSLQCDSFCSSIQVTSGLVDTLLQKFGDDWKSALGFFQWASLHSGYKHTSNAYTKMVDLLGKMNQIDQMLDMVKTMHASGLVTLQTVAKVMRRFAGAGKWVQSVKIFDDLDSIGVTKNVDSMNILLDTLCKEKQVEAARMAFLELKSFIPPNAHTYSILVNGWCNVGRVDEARWTIMEMEGCGLRTSVIVYTSIIKAYCSRSDFQRVYEVLDEMTANHCSPNVVTYTTIMQFLAKSHKIDEAMSLVERMKSLGCKPDTVFYNSLINILGRAGQLYGAANIFEDEMQKNGVDRNLSTYNTMISIYCLHGQEQNAMRVLQEMELACKPDLVTFSPLLKLCFRTGKLDGLLRSLLTDIVDKHNLSFDISTYTLLIHGLCRAGKVEWACSMFDEMVDLQILPRIRTCKLLAMEAEDRKLDGVVERIRNLMKIMEKSNNK